MLSHVAYMATFTLGKGGKEQSGSKPMRGDQAMEIESRHKPAIPERMPSKLEPPPPAEPSSGDILCLQASALEAAIKLNRKKRLEITSIK